MSRVALASLVLLAACSTTPPCVPKIQTVSVNVPVPVACLDAKDVPAEPGLVAMTGDARNDDALLAAKVAALRVWGRTLVAMMKPCER